MICSGGEVVTFSLPSLAWVMESATGAYFVATLSSVVLIIFPGQEWENVAVGRISLGELIAGPCFFCSSSACSWYVTSSYQPLREVTPVIFHCKCGRATRSTTNCFANATTVFSHDTFFLIRIALSFYFGDIRFSWILALPIRIFRKFVGAVLKHVFQFLF